VGFVLSVFNHQKPILAVTILSLAVFLGVSARGDSAAPEAPLGAPGAAPAGGPDGGQGLGQMFIQEYRVKGAHHLSRMEVEDAVYPFLGPARTAGDIEAARGALEKAYHDKGYDTVLVIFPRQQIKGGVVYLQVVETTVGRLRVRGAHYFSPQQIKAQAPSLAEGKVINFNDVPRDIVAMNQLPDRQVTPTLVQGQAPGTVDVDLNVKDTFPLHASLELNNQYSADTTPLRLNGSVTDNNLWQIGHSATFSFQVAPQHLHDAEVFSGSYLVHVQGVDGLSLMATGTKQNSNVSTLGGAAVSGRGKILGLEADYRLPAGKDFYHSVSLGIDYKQFDQEIVTAGVSQSSPVTYYPILINYTATLLGQGSSTDFDAGVTFHLRGLGSTSAAFDNSRFGAGGSFIFFHGDLSHTQDLPGDLQIFGKIQGQLADQPLLSSEQFSAGGLETVRGYLEGEVPSDNAFCTTVELRGPSLVSLLGQKTGEWRFYIFNDAGWVADYNALPQQQSRFTLESFGVGSRMGLFDHFNGSIDAALPLTSQSTTQAHDWRLTFRAGIDY
jgi:hemolysin activation/secretion protein